MEKQNTTTKSMNELPYHQNPPVYPWPFLEDNGKIHTGECDMSLKNNSNVFKIESTEKTTSAIASNINQSLEDNPFDFKQQEQKRKKRQLNLSMTFSNSLVASLEDRARKKNFIENEPFQQLYFEPPSRKASGVIFLRDTKDKSSNSWQSSLSFNNFDVGKKNRKNIATRNETLLDENSKESFDAWKNG